MPNRHATFRPGWLQEQVRKSVALLDQLPPKLRASLAQPTGLHARHRHRSTPQREERTT